MSLIIKIRGVYIFFWLVRGVYIKKWSICIFYTCFFGRRSISDEWGDNILFFELIVDTIIVFI